MSLKLGRVQPDPHGIIPHAKDLNISHTRQPGQIILQAHRGIIGKKQLIVAVILGIERQEHDDVGGLLFCRHSQPFNLFRQFCQGDADPVLNQHRRHIKIGTNLEGNCQRIASVCGAHGTHIDHVFDPVDLLLNRLCHCFRNDLGIGARIGRGDLNGGRCNLGILGNGQPLDGNRSRYQNHNSDDG